MSRNYFFFRYERDFDSVPQSKYDDLESAFEELRENTAKLVTEEEILREKNMELMKARGDACVRDEIRNDLQ